MLDPSKRVPPGGLRKQVLSWPACLVVAGMPRGPGKRIDEGNVDLSLVPSTGCDQRVGIGCWIQAGRTVENGFNTVAEPLPGVVFALG